MSRCWRRFIPDNYWGDGETLVYRCQLEIGHTGRHHHDNGVYAVQWNDDHAFGSDQTKNCQCDYDHIGHWDGDNWCNGKVTKRGKVYPMNKEGY